MIRSHGWGFLFPNIKTRLMDQDLQKIKKMTSFMKKNGLLKLKCGNIELCLDRASIEPKLNTDTQNDEVSAEDKPKFNEMDVLFWSSPGIQEESA